MAESALAAFGRHTSTWFSEAFGSPTPAQVQAWESIGRGDDTLVVAPTGSGKTLAAFLVAIDRLSTSEQSAAEHARVLYISPLKALATDVDRNLRRPLRGIAAVARRGASSRGAVSRGAANENADSSLRDITVGVRTGDTTSDERRRMAAHPPDIVITTPESLFLLLTSRARTILSGVEMVIVDEIHSLAGTKRGAHLAVSLERLDALLPRRAQRVGLSATVRPLEEVGRYLSGGRPVTVVQPPSAKQWDLQVAVPVEDMGALGQVTGDLSGTAAGDERRTSIWPHVEERLVDLIEQQRSTLVFANSRRLAERITARLNEIWDERNVGGDADDQPGGDAVRSAALARAPAEVMAQSGASRGRRHLGAPVLARAHHGSVSREQRTQIEEALKAGQLPAVVATSSLELGIDMGVLDLVIQVEAPPSVAGGLQRVGRAGHHVGVVSHGVFFPKYRGDLVQTAVVVERMLAGRIEAIHVPANPLDVLAQQLVGMCAVDEWRVDEVLTLFRRTASFADLSGSVLESVLDMLSGRYPSEEFAELRPRIVWDRLTNSLTGRPNAQRLAVTSGGTIPDRGLFGVYVAGEGTGRRVGELDEEMVYESRVGDIFTLGTSSWRIQEITHDRVLVSPAPGEPGRLPFWKGDTLGRTAELGAAVGEFVREVSGAPPDRAAERVSACGLDAWATDNLLAYVREQAEATGTVPTDRTLVLERFRDELGDWQLVLHSPYGSRVHAPWALVVAARLRERFGVDVHAMHADDGIVLRLPDVDRGDQETRLLAELGDLITIGPEDVTDLVTAHIGGSALFASRFRECAGRALLLPRRHPGKRQALWQQRQRSAQLLEVASRYPEFPIVLEAVRECLQDVFDVPALVALMRDIESRRVQMVTVDTPAPSPFARSLLFGYVAQFLYEGDSPLAERRAAALALDPSLLAELLGQTQGTSLRDLLDPEVVERTEAELQWLVPERACRDAEAVTDLLRRIGPLSPTEIEARTRPEHRPDVPQWLGDLLAARRVMSVSMAGERRWALTEDAGRLLDGLGAALPTWLPEAFLSPPDDPIGDLAARHARGHGPFAAADLAARLGVGEAVARDALRRLVAAGRVVAGELRPGGAGIDYCDAEVLRVLRRRSLAALRAQVEPVSGRDLARFVPAWQGLTDDHGIPRPALRGIDGLLRAVEQLSGARFPASSLESFVLPGRIAGYSPAMLDEVLASGEVLWQGNGSLIGDDGWISLHLAETAHLTLVPPSPDHRDDDLAVRVLDALGAGGGFFFRGLADALGHEDDASLAEALWRLVWAGCVSNDTFGPMRATLTNGRSSHRSRRPAPRPRRHGRRGIGALGSAARVPQSTMPSRSAPPRTAGRWTSLPSPEREATARALATAEVLLDRHGVLTRGTVLSEEVEGGFAMMYKVLSAAEDSGAVRKGYLVEHLGAAQFASAAAIDRLRAMSRPLGGPAKAGICDQPSTAPSPTGSALQGSGTRVALVLTATDPANPYGAALPWPGRDDGGHRPGRKAGALVVLVDGELVLYVERGGRTLLTFDTDAADGAGTADELDSREGERWAAAARGLAGAVDSGAVDTFTVTQLDDQPALRSGHPVRAALLEAGFHTAPQGLRMRRARG